MIDFKLSRRHVLKIFDSYFNSFRSVDGLYLAPDNIDCIPQDIDCVSHLSLAATRPYFKSYFMRTEKTMSHFSGITEEQLFKDSDFFDVAYLRH